MQTLDLEDNQMFATGKLKREIKERDTSKDSVNSSS